MLKRLAVMLAAGCAWGGAQGRGLEMYWVDVEGGAATLIVTPVGESILIDTGMPGERDPKRIHKAAMEAGLKQIDHLVTTHFHLDHFGGAADLAKLMPIVNVYDSGIPEKNPDNPNDVERFPKQVAPYREMKVGKRVTVKPGDSIPLKQGSGPDLSLRVVAGMQQTAANLKTHDPVDCASGKDKARDTSDNANSLVLVLSYGKFDMFDGGDITWNVEGKLVCPSNLVPQVDIYDVNHHGLDQSNNPLLVQALAPTVSIMSNGISKGCGAETFRTLSSVKSIQAQYQIHRNLRSDSENNAPAEHIANLEKDCQANYIKVSVDPAAKSYTVSIPATGHSRKFQVR